MFFVLVKSPTLQGFRPLIPERLIRAFSNSGSVHPAPFMRFHAPATCLPCGLPCIDPRDHCRRCASECSQILALGSPADGIVNPLKEAYIRMA
ncbi:hypothetical protein [Caballeronia sp. LZ034LL]|uniref:hypothetical protein n=1 Tax=Caballeronia sp. LZ034LL TaxID=3038567 RepID=UPI00285AD799|nr:hypothetical protein [Caballeronia sp. LZ034LL]MDR5838703.1 hypothetical protein [Caballeronia sp. LZ034LL]